MINFPKNIPFHLFATCIIVKGHNRSCIYDVQRGDYEYIPNSLADILNTSKGVTFEALTDSFNEQKDKDILIDYFNFLLEKEFIFFSNLKSSFFPEYKTEFFRPYNISTLIIDLNYYDSEYLDIIKENINRAKVECLVIRFIDSGFDDILKVLQEFNDISTRTIHLFISKDTEFVRSKVNDIFKTNNRISLIVKISDEEEYQENSERGVFINLNEDIINNKFSYKEEAEFSPNLDLFMESKMFNSFHNKRVYINTIGGIFRYEGDNSNFGNIKNIDLMKVLVKPNFNKYWGISKDNIEICNDCEFRYMCVDNRVPIEKNKDKVDFNLSSLFEFSTPCNYNPYTSEWNEPV